MCFTSDHWHLQTTTKSTMFTNGDYLIMNNNESFVIICLTNCSEKDLTLTLNLLHLFFSTVQRLLTSHLLVSASSSTKSGAITVVLPSPISICWHLGSSMTRSQQTNLQKVCIECQGCKCCSHRGTDFSDRLKLKQSQRVKFKKRVEADGGCLAGLPSSPKFVPPNNSAWAKCLRNASAASWLPFWAA